MPDLEASVVFYQQVFDAVLLFQGEQTAYFELAGLWLALNVQDSIPRQELRRSYTHIAFAADEADISEMKHRLQRFGVPLLPDRSRTAGEGLSLYFTDPDGHLLEVHCGSLETRLSLYRQHEQG